MVRGGMMDLKAEFAKRGPWITHYVVDGISTGGDFHALTDHRVDQFFGCFPNVRTILELGSLEGGHTFAMAQRPGVERVVGVDARATNIEKACFIKGLLRVAKAEFAEANLEKTDLASFGRFDAVFCSGLLYHLPEPWRLLEQISQVASHLFIWTHYADELQVDACSGDLKGKEYLEGDLERPNSGMSPKSFWLTLGSLIKTLTVNGFQNIEILNNDLTHSNGPAVTLSARTSRS